MVLKCIYYWKMIWWHQVPFGTSWMKDLGVRSCTGSFSFLVQFFSWSAYAESWPVHGGICLQMKTAVQGVLGFPVPVPWVKWPSVSILLFPLVHTLLFERNLYVGKKKGKTSSWGEPKGGTSRGDSVEKQEIIKQTQSWSCECWSVGTEIQNQVSIKW